MTVVGRVTERGKGEREEREEKEKEKEKEKGGNPIRDGA